MWERKGREAVWEVKSSKEKRDVGRERDRKWIMK